MKLFKRILKILLCVLLAVVIAVVAVEGMYFPRYLAQKKPADITPTAEAGEVKLRLSLPEEYGAPAAVLNFTVEKQ